MHVCEVFVGLEERLARGSFRRGGDWLVVGSSSSPISLRVRPSRPHDLRERGLDGVAERVSFGLGVREGEYQRVGLLPGFGLAHDETQRRRLRPGLVALMAGDQVQRRGALAGQVPVAGAPRQDVAGQGGDALCLRAGHRRRARHGEF